MGFSQGLGYGMLGLFAVFVVLSVMGAGFSAVMTGSCCAGFLCCAVGFSMSSEPQTVVVYR